jgi:competence protein ComEC
MWFNKIICDNMLKLHFLNVGHGDCCILEFPEKVAMVDINRNKTPDDNSLKEIIEASNPTNAKDIRGEFEAGNIDKKTALELAEYTIPIQDPLNYIKKNSMSSVFRFVSTHPHMDHLHGLGELDKTVEISNFWALKNNFKANKSLDKQGAADDWSTYKKYRDNTAESQAEEITPKTVIRPMEKSTGDVYTSDGIKILAPTPELLELSENEGSANIMSYVLLVDYPPHKIILGGDAEKDTWKYVLEHYPEEIKDITVLKAAHHGRNSGYYEPAMKQMHPQYTIVSVGAKLDPSLDATKKYTQFTENLITTRWQGNVTIECHENGDLKCEPQFK